MNFRPLAAWLSLACALFTLQPALATTCPQLREYLHSLRPRDQIALDRFVQPIEQLRRAFRSAHRDANQAVDLISTGAGRGALFKLEELFALYENLPSARGKFGEWHEFNKALEDAIGKYGERVDAVKEAAKLHLPPEETAFLKGEREERRRALRNLIQRSGWLEDRGDGALARMIETLRSVEWPSQRDDRDYVLKTLIHDARKLQRTRWDMANLQGLHGLHDLRREIRKTLIRIQAVRGRIQIAPSESFPSRFASLLTGDPIPPEYLTFPIDPRIKHPGTLPDFEWLGLSQLSQKLSQIKERGEIREWMAHAYLGTGRAKNAAEADAMALKLMSDAGRNGDYLPDSRALYREVRRSRFFPALTKTFEDQR